VSAVPADASSVLARVAADTLGAQARLDELAREGADRWDDTGIPPWAGAISGLRAELETRLGAAARTRAGAPSRLLLLGDAPRPARIALTLALRPTERSHDAGDD
jgi:hypothetical protein